jgi:hypothetical protein
VAIAIGKSTAFYRALEENVSGIGSPKKLTASYQKNGFIYSRFINGLFNGTVLKFELSVSFF